MASGSQNSLLSVGSQSLSLTATGQGLFEAAGADAAANTSSTYYVVFSVDTPTAYTLTESTSQEVCRFE